MLDFLITKLYNALEKSSESKQVRTSKKILFVKKLLADIHEDTLDKVDFPNYHNFESINDAHSNFIQKVMAY